MITKLSIKNIRIFQNQDWEFDLKNLTAFCGTNSSGKSTILKTILLLSQTQQLAMTANYLSGRLVFNGPLIEMGDYKSLVSNNDISKNIEIKIETNIRISSSELSFLQFINQPTKEIRPTFSGSAVSYDQPVEDEDIKVKFSIIFSFRSNPDLINPDVTNYEGILDQAKFSITNGDDELINWEIHLDSTISTPNKQSIRYLILLPKEYLNQTFNNENDNYDFENENFSPIKDSPFLQPNYVQLETNLNGLLPSNLIIQEKDHFGISSIRVLPLTNILESSIRQFNQALLKIDYLSAFRFPGERYYDLRGSNDGNLDPSGHKISMILDPSNLPQEIAYIHPKQQVIVKTSLIIALNSWLYFIRTGDFPDKDDLNKNRELSVEKTKILLELAVKNGFGSKSYSLVDSGFGYSQILPIILRGLILKDEEIFIVEQPEVHLNPALQVRLSEFFISLIMNNRQLIIETHSEHIINSIRVIVAESNNSFLSFNNVIYYLEEHPGLPKIHNLTIQQNGLIPKWPSSFFGDAATLAGRLLRAQKKH